MVAPAKHLEKTMTYTYDETQTTRIRRDNVRILELRDKAIEAGGVFQDTIEDCGKDNIPCGMCDECIDQGIYDYD